MSEYPIRIFGFAAMTVRSRYGSSRIESSPPMDATIARIDGSANASLTSAARHRGSARSSAAEARVDGNSWISRPQSRSWARPRSKTCGKACGPPQDGDTTATPSPGLSRRGLTIGQSVMAGAYSPERAIRRPGSTRYTGPPEPRAPQAPSGRQSDSRRTHPLSKRQAAIRRLLADLSHPDTRGPAVRRVRSRAGREWRDRFGSAGPGRATDATAGSTPVKRPDSWYVGEWSKLAARRVSA